MYNLNNVNLILKAGKIKPADVIEMTCGGQQNGFTAYTDKLLICVEKNDVAIEFKGLLVVTSTGAKEFEKVIESQKLMSDKISEILGKSKPPTTSPAVPGNKEMVERIANRQAALSKAAAAEADLGDVGDLPTPPGAVLGKGTSVSIGIPGFS